ncbi:glycosyltransferase [Endozoicomonas sp. ALE010]|uniref:glycosyltransferase n=1 Tax=Endozoicomonas sp. ALE010 TaxID=3403081 RepID=UPI003BB4D0C8
MNNTNPQPYKINVSVIIPIYNAEKHLQESLTSIEEQTLDNIQVILVDDSSPDNSYAIAKAFTDRLKNWHLLKQENGGCSVARNTGFANATGEYTIFIDADDLLKPEMLKHLYETAKKEALDVCSCMAEIFWDHKEGKKILFQQEDSGIVSGQDWLSKVILSNDFHHGVWLNLVKSDFLRQHQLDFIPGLFHQDIPWTTEVYLKAERLHFIAEPLYQYRFHHASSSNTRNYEKRKKIVDSYIRIIDVLYRDLKGGHPRHVQDALHFQIADEGLGIFHYIEKMPSRRDRNQLHSLMRQHRTLSKIWESAKTGKHKRRCLRRGWSMYKDLLIGSVS